MRGYTKSNVGDFRTAPSMCLQATRSSQFVKTLDVVKHRLFTDVRQRREIARGHPKTTYEPSAIAGHGRYTMKQHFVRFHFVKVNMP